MIESERTPKRVASDGSSSRKRSNRSIGDHTGSPKMTCEEELTMMPRKLTMENVRGTARSCGRPAAEGRLARDAKSGALLWGDAHAYIQPVKRAKGRMSPRDAVAAAAAERT